MPPGRHQAAIIRSPSVAACTGVSWVCSTPPLTETRSSPRQSDMHHRGRIATKNVEGSQVGDKDEDVTFSKVRHREHAERVSGLCATLNHNYVGRLVSTLVVYLIHTNHGKNSGIMTSATRPKHLRAETYGNFWCGDQRYGNKTNEHLEDTKKPNLALGGRLTRTKPRTSCFSR